MKQRRGDGRRNQRSEAAQAYSGWYDLARWKRIRRYQLTIEPLCRICKAKGRVTPATVCDHIEPHRGDPVKFWNGPFQSLCDAEPWRCHSSVKQQQELHGYSTEVGENGYPTDPAHPFTQGRR